MTSESAEVPTTRNHDTYVWVWLPNADVPVVAGKLEPTNQTFGGERVLAFGYARSYRARGDAISLFTPELPLRPGRFNPTAGPRSPLALAGCLRDAAPDAWGRRVINSRYGGDPDVQLDETTYLTSSGSDRIGALDFQDSPAEYVHRGDNATLDQLIAMADIVERGEALPPDLDAAAAHGTSIGGARPKAVLDDGDRQLIAKFASSTDDRPVVRAEAAGMLLAARIGIDVPPVEVVRSAGKDVLLIERFDRTPERSRRLMVSALTILGLREEEARHASYVDLARAIRQGGWPNPADQLRELFTRVVLNVAVSNTDDHLRNHAAFWDGHELTLTPAYDVAPQRRSTSVATHAIGLTSDGERHSQFRNALAATGDFLLSKKHAQEIVDHVVSTVRAEWPAVCDEARLSSAERQALWGREILNPYAFYDMP